MSQEVKNLFLTPIIMSPTQTDQLVNVRKVKEPEKPLRNKK